MSIALWFNTRDRHDSIQTAMLWKSATLRQQVYANPGRQRHRGYDEDEFWFQFSGSVAQESMLLIPFEASQCSMAEAGISHTSTSLPGANRLTTYTNKPLRMVVNPSEHLRETRWERSGDT